MLLLCERCHAMQEVVPINIRYPNAACWFCLVFWEIIIHEMVTALILPEQPEPTSHNTDHFFGQNPAHRKKRNQIQAEMHEVMQLQVNYKLLVEEDKESAVFLLFQVATALAQKSNVFCTRYWKPFLNAYKAQIRVKSTSKWGLVVRENNRIYVQTGKGKAKRSLPAPPESVKKLFFETFV